MPWPKKHGMYGTSFYQRWRAMQNRCTNQKHPAYHRYGGRGIKCEWESFDDFKRDMYQQYINHVSINGEKFTQLDRIDNDKNYSKQNCRWTTPKENILNSSIPKLLSFMGKTMCIRDWSKSLGFNKNAISERLRRGWTIERALTTPFITNREKGLISTSKRWASKNDAKRLPA